MALVKISPIFNGIQVFDNVGNPISGARLFTYQAGSFSVLQPTYNGVLGDVPNNNPMVTNSSGRFTSSIWLTVGQGYNLVLTLPDGTTILGSWDNVTSGDAGGVVASSVALNGGTAGVIPWQSAAGVTSFTAPGTVGYFLISNGTNAPQWTSSVTATGMVTTANIQINSLGVGTAASGTAGEIRATNDITAYYSSDARLKENVISIPDALNKVLSLRGVMFDWTQDYIDIHGGEDGYFIRKHDTGVIAQEVQKIMPEVVGQRDGGILAVKYDRLVGVLIEAIKELAAEVEVLKNDS